MTFDSVDSVVVLRSGRRVRLRAKESPTHASELGGESRALTSHLRAALVAWRESESRGDVAALVARGSRSALEWLADLNHRA